MIFLFYGDDTDRKHKGYAAFLKSISPETEKFFFGKRVLDKNFFENFFSGQGLFFKKCAVIFSGVSEAGDFYQFVLKNISTLSSSPNLFVFLEGEMDKNDLDIFKESGAEINFFPLSKQKKEKYNNFLLADAFASRDRFHLWLFFRQAVDLGVSLEELTGVLFWKVKDMILKKNFSKVKEGELKKILVELPFLLLQSRKEGRDAEAVLERFLLKIF